MTEPPAALWPAIVAAARQCIGTRFRAQGRTPGLALDCVGLLLVAARAAGVTAEAPAYALGGDHRALAADLWRFGLLPVANAEAGDILVMAPAAQQRHFGIVTPLGLVQAHAGLGRVVEGPIDRTWPIIAAWRFPGAR